MNLSSKINNVKIKLKSLKNYFWSKKVKSD
jgi:hypothetical protein